MNNMLHHYAGMLVCFSTETKQLLEWDTDDNGSEKYLVFFEYYSLVRKEKQTNNVS